VCDFGKEIDALGETVPFKVRGWFYQQQMDGCQATIALIECPNAAHYWDSSKRHVRGHCGTKLCPLYPRAEDEAQR